MALLEIRTFPDPVLRAATRAVAAFDDDLRRLVADMTETMYAARGAGLAAIQVGRTERLFLIDATVAGGSESEPPLVFVNPELVAQDGKQEGEEGCLSFPGVFIEVPRAARCTVRALDVEGKPFEVAAQGLYARALQHEIDHLRNRLLIDYAGPVKKRLIKRRMERREWENEEPTAEVGPRL